MGAIMEQRVSVTFSAPVKVEGIARRPGDSAAVTITTAAQLEEMGVIEPIALGVSVAELVPGAPGFDEAVAAAAQALAETMIDAAISASIGPLEAEKNAAAARAAEAEAQRDLLQARVLELQAQLAATTPTSPSGETAGNEAEDPPPAAPKKAAAAKKKG